MKAGCSVDGCGREFYGRGLCNLHYARSRRDGVPVMAASSRGLPLEQRVLKFFRKSEGCWEWSSLSSEGYGQIKVNGRMRPAHVVMYELEVGPIPDAMEVDHQCRQRSCVRPDHLRVVTNKQNMENLSGPNRNNNSSRVRGVTWDKSNRKWIAQIGHNNQRFHIGSFLTLTEAESAVVARRNELFTHNDADRRIA